jgi:hypothetical protein
MKQWRIGVATEFPFIFICAPVTYLLLITYTDQLPWQISNLDTCLLNN